MKKIPKIYWLLLLVVLFGGVGIFYNYGITAGGPDESLKIYPTLKFFRDFNLVDKYSAFFPMATISEIPFAGFLLGAYLVLGIGDIGQLKELVIVDTYKMTPYFRFITIIFGLITVYVFYKICREIFKKERPALIASYFLATSFSFIQQIHISTAWVQQTMFILIAVYYFLTLLKRKKWGVGVFIISALLVVFSLEIELVGLIAIIPFFLIYLQARKEGKIDKEALKLSVFGLIFLSGLVLFYYLGPATFKEYFSLAGQVAGAGFKETVYGQGLLGRFFGFFEISFLLEPFLLMLFFFGLFAAYKKDRFLFKIFGSYILVYYLVLGPLAGGFVERRILLAIPALAVFSAFFLEHLITKYPIRGLKKFLGAGLLVFLINPLLFDFASLKKSSGIEAKEWIIRNVPADSSISDMCWLELNENEEMLKEIKENYPSLFTTRRKYLLEHPYILDSRKNYFVVRENEIRDNINPKNFQYLIVCYFNDKKKRETLANFEKVEKIRVYDSLTGRQKFKATDLFNLIDFSDLKNSGLQRLFNLPYHGQHFEIYELSDYFRYARPLN